MVPHSPFLVIQDFISPLLCEDVLDELDFITPNVDVDGAPQRMFKSSETSEDLLIDRIYNIVPTLEEHYNGFEYVGTERPKFDWFPEGTNDDVHCESSEYLKKKWVRVRQRDLTGVLFLSSYQDKVPFDTDYEVYGGKLEFMQHDFGFNPQRGTLIVFPSGPHFLNATQSIIHGDLFQCKMHFASKEFYLYEPANFPGDYTNWFNDIN